MRILKPSSSSQSRLACLEETKDALYILVRVQPKARKNELSLTENKEALKVKLKSPPVDGEANKELVKLLSKSLKIKKSSITITSGKKSRDKRVKLEGVEPREIEAALQQLAE
ncbi:MAG: YggU family protein [Proteobacteria bacterium]|nr:YggU family protein [Pseudomonadota bacterium]